MLRTVPVPGMNPDAILYEPAGKRLYTFNGKSTDVTVFDAAALTVVAKLAVPGKPEFAQADGKGHVFLNIETEPGQMVRIDAVKLAVEATWPLPGCNSPSGLAIDRAHERLFSVCDGKVMAVTDGETGKRVARSRSATAPMPPSSTPSAASCSAPTARWHADDRAPGHARPVPVAATLPTQKGARTMAFDPSTHRVYLVTAEFGAPPAPTAAGPRPRPPMVPDTFTVLVAAPR